MAYGHNERFLSSCHHGYKPIKEKELTELSLAVWLLKSFLPIM